MRLDGRTAPESGSCSTGHLSSDRWPARMADRYETLSWALRPVLSLGRAVSPAMNMAGLPTVLPDVVGVCLAAAPTSPLDVFGSSVAACASGLLLHAETASAHVRASGARYSRNIIDD